MHTGHDIAADRRGGRGGAGGVAARQCTTMHVGAPFMTPGAGTARPVRGIALDGVRGGAGHLRQPEAVIRATQVSPLRRGVFVHGIAAERRGGPVVPAVVRRTTRDDARRGAIYDARCRNGTTRPRHCVGRYTRWCRQIVILRRSSGRHKCRPYGAGCSSTILRRTDRATQVSPLRCGMFVRDIAAGRGCQRSTISTTGTVLTNSRLVT